MSYRLLASIMGLCLVSCAKSPQVEETTVSRSASLAEAKPWPKEALKAAGVATTAPEPAPQRAAKPAPQREAKKAKTEIEEEEWENQDFSGTDTSAPVDDPNNEGPREVIVEGIEGTTSEFDVRVTLENRAEDFDRCHDENGGGGGRIVYRIHIEASGDVGGVKARTIKSRNRKLVACYTEVVASSHFPKPHGGYADVKWTTKVGRSKKKPNSDLYERPHRWDTPSGSRASK